jgi:hypothetical protein
MWWVEWLRRLVSPYHREWRVFYDHMIMECRIADVPDGVEIQYLFRGEPYHSFRHRTRPDAQNEARRTRTDLIERGWLEDSWAADGERAAG